MYRLHVVATVSIIQDRATIRLRSDTLNANIFVFLVVIFVPCAFGFVAVMVFVSVVVSENITVRQAV